MKASKLFLFIKKILYVFYPKMEVEGKNHLPQEPCILVGNHAQIHGPIACELYLPDTFTTWCAGQMMNLKEVPDYAFQDFWAKKPEISHCFYRILSYLIAPLSVVLFNNARTVPVYRDNRILSTFKESIRQLERGRSIVIFPEYDKAYNHIIYDFQERFIDLAKIYYKKTGKEIKFVPLYITPRLKKMVLGEPVSFDSQAEIEGERKRIRAELMKKITFLGEKLPCHTVIPYRNIRKKDYPKNRGE
ncbi:MAG: hypothetical protein J6A56_01330 [Clostridia bacterium]|nr:hypothetical protein [Clostridia bacterium]